VLDHITGQHRSEKDPRMKAKVKPGILNFTLGVAEGLFCVHAYVLVVDADVSLYPLFHFLHR
jgi:hypothetical protein